MFVYSYECRIPLLASYEFAKLQTQQNRRPVPHFFFIKYHFEATELKKYSPAVQYLDENFFCEKLVLDSDICKNRHWSQQIFSLSYQLYNKKKIACERFEAKNGLNKMMHYFQSSIP